MSVIGNDGHVVALTTLRAERAGKKLQDDTVRVFHVQHGKVSEVWSYPADLYASDLVVRNRLAGQDKARLGYPGKAAGNVAVPGDRPW